MKKLQSSGKVGSYLAPELSVLICMSDCVLCQSSGATLTDLDVIDYGEI